MTSPRSLARTVAAVGFVAALALTAVACSSDAAGESTPTTSPQTSTTVSPIEIGTPTSIDAPPETSTP